MWKTGVHRSRRFQIPIHFLIKPAVNLLLGSAVDPAYPMNGSYVIPSAFIAAMIGSEKKTVSK